MSLFSAATVLSESRPWFVSLAARLRDSFHEFQHPTPHVSVTAQPVEVPEAWSAHRMSVPRTMSILLHAAILTASLMPSGTPGKTLPKGLIVVDINTGPLRLPVLAKAQGGGGGGRREMTPPSLG